MATKVKRATAARKAADVPIPKTVEFVPDNAERKAFFLDSSRKADAISDNLRSTKKTEAELLAWASQLSGLPIPEIARRGAQAEAKKIVSSRLGKKSGRGVFGARDNEYIAALREMQDENDRRSKAKDPEQRKPLPLTAGRLVGRVDRGNLRTARRVLEMHGINPYTGAAL
jgi:hypothetical protein